MDEVLQCEFVSLAYALMPVTHMMVVLWKNEL